ncbi:hypothetical protein GCM10027589_14530 [Actinocorallia lasiicapitis]
MLALYPSSRYGSPLKAMSAVISDTVGCRTHHNLQAISAVTPTYAYLFDDPQAPPVLPGLAPGPVHSAELEHLFTPDSPRLNPAQRDLADRMIGHWSAFATTGAPAWPAYHPLFQQVRVLHPTDTRTLGFGALYLRHRCYIWDLFGSLTP